MNPNLSKLPAVWQMIGRSSRNLGFLTLDPRFASAPYFSGHISPTLPSQNSKHWKAVRNEVSNNDGTDTDGGPAIVAPLTHSGVFNVPR